MRSRWMASSCKKIWSKIFKDSWIDLLKIEKIDNVVSIEKDIFDEDIKEIIKKILPIKLDF